MRASTLCLPGLLAATPVPAAIDPKWSRRAVYVPVAGDSSFAAPLQ